MIAENSIVEVVDILNVSRSIKSQLNKEDMKHDDMHKVLVKFEEKNFVIYLIEGCEFGPGAKFRVLNSKSYPIFYKNDYQLVLKTMYEKNTKLLDLMLNKK